MYNIKIDNTILNQPFNDLQVKQLVKNSKLEILSISLAKGAVFPPHESHEDAHLIVIEGQIAFYIEENPIILSEQQQFSFPKNKSHWVEAHKDSKFLIVR
ncbi:cupin domain-containing protein [uncultured Croceitalea sp.]|uniref:cupin domain-containing protein n=1 Tax=uncultured Croceitalea sp. TaxID=1798908 RepID=UPI003305FFF6